MGMKAMAKVSSFRLSAKKIWVSIKDKFREYSKAWIIGIMAAFHFVFAAGGAIFLAMFPSVTDQAVKALNLLWMQCTLMCPIFICGALGMYAAMSRSVGATRYFYFMIPLAVACNIPVSMTMFSLGCNCRDFLQCSALDSFARKRGNILNNPHPAIPGYTKFESKRKIPFVPFPDQKGYRRAAGATSLVQSFEANVSDDHMDRIASGISNMYESYAEQGASQLKTLNRRIASTARKKNANDREALNLVTASIRQAPGALSPSDIREFEIPWRTNPRWTKKRIPIRMAKDIKTVSSLVNVDVDAHGQQNARPVGGQLNETDESPVYSDDSEQMLALDLYKIRDNSFVIYDSANEDEKYKCDTVELKETTNLMNHVRQCRRILDTFCPERVQRALRDCASKQACGGLKIDLAPLKSTETEDEIQGDMTWKVTFCEMQQPVFVKDYDPNHHKQPNTVYFERDFTKSIEMTPDAVEAQILQIGIEKQQLMPKGEWLDHMQKMQDATCTCDPASRGCKANVDHLTGSTEYWCAINKEKKNVCSRTFRPRIDDLKPMPQEDDNRFWSKKICTGAEMCKCQDGMGVRVWGSQLDELNDQLRQQVRDSEQSDVMIGWKCGKWYKTDRAPWCVVGFDSPCADRTEMHINPKTHLKVWTSMQPCSMSEFHNVVADAEEFCLGMRLLWIIMDVIGYVLVFPMFYMSYLFLINRCSDGAPNSMSSFKVTGDEEDLNWFSEKTQSGSSRSSDSESEDPIGKRSPHKKTSAKAQSKLKPTKEVKDESESSWSDDTEESDPHGQKRRKDPHGQKRRK